MSAKRSNPTATSKITQPGIITTFANMSPSYHLGIGCLQTKSAGLPLAPARQTKLTLPARCGQSSLVAGRQWPDESGTTLRAEAADVPGQVIVTPPALSGRGHAVTP